MSTQSAQLLVYNCIRRLSRRYRHQRLDTRDVDLVALQRGLAALKLTR